MSDDDKLGFARQRMDCFMGACRMTTLWSANTPQTFWQCQPDPAQEQWAEAVRRAVPVLGLPVQADDIDTILELVLGEGQFGPERWRLSRAKRLYYALKPVLPRRFTQILRRLYGGTAREAFPLGWPVEQRYVRFLWAVVRQLLVVTGRADLSYRRFWPEGHRFSFVLTHDVERADGQAYVRAVADLDESLGFRSSFNFVPEGYRLDYDLLHELRTRGFEIGVHGLRHDEKLFRSRAEFLRTAAHINRYLHELGAVGFRAPMMHRQPQWMQELDIEYDLSFFDTDPFEPMSGGTMTIWPFQLGRFVELPYTLTQDHTLVTVLGETTPRLWQEKVDFLERYHGMALVNAHPDYLRNSATRRIYAGFLQTMRERGSCWNALPMDVARWWRKRADPACCAESLGVQLGKVTLVDDDLVLF
jgi:peptidoglycan/xylan/chitin deacetylase (PgdA/CDA1 family)